MAWSMARPHLLRMVSRVTRNHAGANAPQNHVPGSRARVTNRRPASNASRWACGYNGESQKNRQETMMNKIVHQSASFGFVIGTLLALYISLSMFWVMSHDLWLALHNFLVVASLVLAAFIGYQNRNLGFSMGSLVLSIAVFFSIIMLLYIGSYAMTTSFLADKMMWIPFFYNDYHYHGFTSPAEYLSHENNYVELLKLQVFSLLISSVMYVIAGSLGFVGKTVLETMGKSSSMAR
jgi:hypothetical protein